MIFRLYWNTFFSSIEQMDVFFAAICRFMETKPGAETSFSGTTGRIPALPLWNPTGKSPKKRTGKKKRLYPQTGNTARNFKENNTEAAIL